jgi:phenylacetate-CoA ligase
MNAEEHQPFAAEQLWRLDREQLQSWQLSHLNKQFAAILPLNRFYREKLGQAELRLNSLEELSTLPYTTKDELVASAEQDPAGISAHHTFSLERYSRFHRTSGTTGKPLLILDTAEDWQWWSTTWQHVLQSAGVTGRDRAFLAFSFGPFIGFWTAHQACVDRGASVIPGGGLSSLARLEFLHATQATTVFCTPSYALHLAEVAREAGMELGQSSVQRIVVAGESGGSVPAVRDSIQQAWNAQVIDHSGATEIGPWGFGWPDRPGLQIIESSFIAEFLPVECDDPQSAGLCELVLTSLGRLGAPVVRYRTGDIVRPQPAAGDERCNFRWLPEGVIGRVDNMVTIRGVNVFPSSIAALIGEFPQVVEYRALISRPEQMDQLELEVEGAAVIAEEIERLLNSRLGLRIAVRPVQPGSLPRSDGKSRRWLDLRRLPN